MTKWLMRFLIILIFMPALAKAGAVITYHGRILDSSDRPVETSNVTFRIRILSPNPGKCLLYEELRTISMVGTNGVFVIPIGDGVGVRTSVDPGIVMEKIFSNDPNLTFDTTNTPKLVCNSGSSYTPGVLQQRQLSVTFDDHSGVGEQTLPMMDINYVPLAVSSYDAQNIGGVPAASVLRLTTGNATALTPANFAELLNLINGTSTQYLKTETDPSVKSFAKNNLPVCGANQFLKDDGSGNLICVTAASGGVTSVTGTAGQVNVTAGATPVVSLVNTGVTAGTYVTTSSKTISNLQVDATGRVVSVSDAVISLNGNQITQGVVAPGFGGTGLSSLGTANQVLGVNGAGTGLEYKTITGTVSSITAGAGLTGGTITTSGTIGLGTELSAINSVVSNGILQRTGPGTYVTLGVTAPVNITAGNIGVSVGTGAGTVAAGDDSRITGALQTSAYTTDITPAASCTATQTVYWNTVSDAWACQNINFGSASVLSNLTAAAATNSINNADHAQVWNWSLTTAAKSAFKFTENTASTNGTGSQYLVDIGTIANSTANPFRVQARGSDVINISRSGNVDITGLTAAGGFTGSDINITSGAAIGLFKAGDITIKGGSGQAGGGNGTVTVQGSDGPGGAAGPVYIKGGNAANAGTSIGGAVYIQGGAAYNVGGSSGGAVAISTTNAPGGASGNISVITGNAGVGFGNGQPAGSITISAGTGGTATAGWTGGTGASVNISAGHGGDSSGGGNGGVGGNLNLTAGNAGINGNANGGSLVLNGGTKTGTGTDGDVLLATLRGNVGIGTATPGQRLTVAGTVESTSGGFKFPDGSVQTTAATPGIPNRILVVDQKAAGVAGGTFTMGSWVTRTLNTTVFNNITGASLASNQVTLPAGTYYVRASAPAYYAARHQAMLYNVTGAVYLVAGTGEVSNSTNGSETSSVVEGQFTLSVTSVVELRHQCTSTAAGTGLGVAGNFGVPEVYAKVYIEKVQ